MKSQYRLRCILTLTALCALSVPLSAPAQPQAQSVASVSQATAAALPKVAFEQFTLPNGLQVILHVDRKLPIVHVNQWFHVGSKNEVARRTGFAHLFEHMMFQGSKNAPGEYFTYVERAGANIREGGVNGTTNEDRTNYFSTAPSGKLEYLLWLESDRLATLLDDLTLAKLDNQREVVKNERRQGLENQPYGRAFKLISENLFPAGHPYSWPVIGSQEDLNAATLEDVKDFFRTYYTPNNLSLVIAGDFEPAEAKRLVEKYFGSIPPGPALDRPARWVPQLTSERIVTVRDRVPLARTYLAWPTPPYFDKDEAELDLAALILSDGLSSRLKKAAIYDKQLSSEVTAFNGTSEISDTFVITATARPGVSQVEMEQVITAAIKRLAKDGPTEAELNRAKTKQEFGFVSGLERIGGFGGKADRLNQYNTFLGVPDKFEADVERYRRVTPATLKAAVAKWLDTPNRLLVRFQPETSGRVASTAPDRATVPGIGEDRAFQTPQVKSAKLANGLDIFVVERPDLPKVSVDLATRAGATGDPKGKEGVAYLTLKALNRGTKTQNALTIEDRLGNLGTELGSATSREYSQISFEVLKRNLAPALEVVADVILNPTFPAAEVDRVKKEHLDFLEQGNKDPNTIAARIRSILAFGREHPYGRPAQGLTTTVAPLKREDLVQYYQTFLKPGGSALIFVGDITLAEATELAKKTLGSWKGGEAPAVTIPTPQPVGPGKVFLVDRQDAAQTVVLQILNAPNRTSTDYYSLQLADAVWGGGGFGTRLNLNLREDKGYSYGVFSNRLLLKNAGVWWAQGGVQTDKTKESLVEFAGELKALNGTKPISEQELAAAKTTRTRGYAQQFESLSRIAGQIAELWAYGLPMTRLQQESEQLSKTPLAEVNQIAQKYAIPAQATLLLVGDRAKIEAGVRSLNLGELVILDAEGKSITP